MTSTIGIPIKLLNEAQGHVITLEITSGQVYRGKLLEGTSSLPLRSSSSPPPGLGLCAHETLLAPLSSFKSPVPTR